MFATIPQLIEDVRQGKMVILLDANNRENEGDLVVAAPMITPDHINFMTKYARGIVCLAMPQAWCEHLKLPLIGDDNSKYRANFTVSIEAASGVTTGVSTFDRAHTIKTAANPNAVANDLVRPGHVFPLMAQPGGVFTRAGHTEATTDLVRLAGFKPAAAVLCEVMTDDGNMARLPDLEIFAKKHDIKLGLIVDLIEYRMQTEKQPEVELAE